MLFKVNCFFFCTILPTFAAFSCTHSNIHSIFFTNLKTFNRMKGNMFLGMARGSVGDVTFARSKGQQVARARNRQPNNPRTVAQMTQRSIFMDAVKFFSRGVQNLFTFAFEDKRANESDYNAFMRHNAKNGIYLTKDRYDDSKFPAIGNWMVTNGTLSAFNNSIASDLISGDSGVAVRSVSSITTVGTLSAALLTSGNFMAGDIITIVVIDTDATLGTAPIPVVPGATQPKWLIQQFILDVADTTTLSSLNISVAKSTGGNLVIGSSVTISAIGGAAIIHSRKTQGGVKVSSQFIVNNSSAVTALEQGTSAAWLDVVLADWSAREAAVLEGSLASKE